MTSGAVLRKTLVGLTPRALRLVNLGRHRRNCNICPHQHPEEIEREFINWTGAKAIAKEFGLADRTAVYHHAHAFNLFSMRQGNIRAALEKIIENAGEVEVPSAAVVAAVVNQG